MAAIHPSTPAPTRGHAAVTRAVSHLPDALPMRHRCLGPTRLLPLTMAAALALVCGCTVAPSHGVDTKFLDRVHKDPFPTAEQAGLRPEGA